MTNAHSSSPAASGSKRGPRPLVPTAVPPNIHQAHIVWNERYPAAFRQSITVPVVSDARKPPQGVFAGHKLPASFTVRVDDAIELADRHLFIVDRVPNPVRMVRDWTNLLRWECGTFWNVDPANNWYGLNTKGSVQMTEEHPKRSGEILAEGIALLFVSKWLHVGRQNFYFLESPLARPDYVIERSAGMLKNNRRAGIEIRCRATRAPLRNGGYRNYLMKEDYDDLDRKKAHNQHHRLSDTLGVYCFYGLEPANIHGQRPRIHLVDPPGACQPMGEVEIARRMAGYYSGVASRIGLWRIRDRMNEAVHSIEHGSFPAHDPSRKPLSFTRAELRRTFGKDNYRGRWFSSLLALEGQLGKAWVISQMRSHRYGSIVYHGLNETVARLLDGWLWRDAAEFFDRNTGDVLDADGRTAFVTSDGVVKLEYEIAPGSRDASDLEATYGLRS